MTRERRIFLGAVLLAQTLFFFATLHRPIAVESDNLRYEVAAWNLASGRSMTLPYRDAPDADVQAWACTRHPTACADASYPVAIYPPGYSIFVAGIYKLCGRSLVAVLAVQLALLWLLFALFERMAARLLDPTGYRFAMIVAATYPFLAAQANRIMSDHLGTVLFGAALAARVLMQPGRWRGALFGALMSLATLTRPYSLLVFPVILAWPSLWRAATAARWERWIALVAFLVPLGMWSARNGYWYGRFVPLTTNGVGLTLYHTTLEFDASFYDAPETRYYQDVIARYGDDGLSWASSRALMKDAIVRIEQRPLAMVERVLVHVPKLWISLGSSGHGKSRAWPFLLVYLGSLWVLGIGGMLTTWRDSRWQVLILAILLYWCFLLPLPGEARRTQALRLPHLLLAAAFVSDLVARRRRANSFLRAM